MNQEESIYWRLSHNVSNLVYHIVCPAKYRRSVFSDRVEECLKNTCREIEIRYDWIRFLEIGADVNHVHFMVQSTPDHSVSQIVKVIKSITARQVFEECPEVKKQLGDEHFWSDGFFAATVDRYSNRDVFRYYVRTQGEDCEGYKQLSFKI